MSRIGVRHSPPNGALLVLGLLAGTVASGLGAALVALLISSFTDSNDCSAPSITDAIVLGPAGSGQRVGASEYGGPGDPSSGVVGASGANLLQHPDSFAELGGYTFQTAAAMGGLPYMSPLRVTWENHSALAYKRDFGLGGGPIEGLPRVIDLWWQFAARLGIPYENGLWSGPVRIERPPAGGAANLLGQTSGQTGTLMAPSTAAADPGTCAPGTVAGVPLAPGQRARLLPNGLAAAPQAAPGQSRRSSRPGTRSSASRTYTAAPTGCRWTRWHRRTTARAAWSICSTARGCCRSLMARHPRSSNPSGRPAQVAG